MKKNALFTSLSLLLAFGLTSCLKEPKVVEAVKLNLPAEPYNYANIVMPGNMQAEFMMNAPQVFPSINGGIGIDPIDPVFPIDPIPGFNNNVVQNPSVNDHGATLGRVLFYDTKLSLNNAVACASCHKQEAAFADPTAGSQGFEGKVTPRNSMAIVNVALNRNLFWDSRVQSAVELTLKPVQNHIEMGMEDLSVLVKKLSNTDYYPDLFNKAFGSHEITEQRISDALAQFLCSMVSVNSRFDSFSNGDVSALTELEQLGMNVFFRADTKCSQCHSGGNFMADDRPGGAYGDDNSFGGTGGNGPKGTANNGLDIVTND
ncbi:MAG: cytochrome-c peroxidase, partial [Saprospiraceae bacterium]|nr:cytochrome-c peroxidase [Saprospiraceae bacterium]